MGNAFGRIAGAARWCWKNLPHPAAISRWLDTIIAYTAAAIVGTIFVAGAAALLLDRLPKDTSTLGRLALAVALFVITVLVAFASARSAYRACARLRTALVPNLLRVAVLAAAVVVLVAIAPVHVMLHITALDEFEWPWRRAEPSPIEAHVPPTGPEMPFDEIMLRNRAITREYRAVGSPRVILERMANVRQWRDIVEPAAAAAGVDPVRVEAIMAVESRGNRDATSAAGALGLMQLMPGTARQYGIGNPRDITDPPQNVAAAVRYLVYLAGHYQGDWDTVYAAYNCGEGEFDRLDVLARRSSREDRDGFWKVRSLLRRETQEFVPRVLMWELIFRYHDAHGELPPRDGNHHEHLAARYDPPERSVWSSWFRIGSAGHQWYQGGQSAFTRPQPTSNVWYTARAGDTIGDVLYTLGAPTGAIAQLNPGLTAAGTALTPGKRVLLPESAFAFAAAGENDTLCDFAERHGMSLPDLLRWSGRISTIEAEALARRDCSDGECPEDCVPAGAGTQYLVARQP